jgi:hypothetical protein
LNIYEETRRIDNLRSGRQRLVFLALLIAIVALAYTLWSGFQTFSSEMLASSSENQAISATALQIELDRNFSASPSPESSNPGIIDLQPTSTGEARGQWGAGDRR